jgi:hypothetical protein
LKDHHARRIVRENRSLAAFPGDRRAPARTTARLPRFRLPPADHRLGRFHLRHIAEGAERNTKPEFRQFLGYAKGSAGETHSRLYIAKRLGYISAAEADVLLDELRRISRMIHALIQSLDR